MSLTDSVQFQFNSEDPLGTGGSSASGIVLERSSQKADREDETLFRVHGGAGHTLSSTSGFIAVRDHGLRRFTSQFLFFEATAYQALRYPGAQSVALRLVGTATSSSGELVTPDIYFDAAKNAVASDLAFYGVVLVEYEAPYSLWRARFSGACPSVETFVAYLGSRASSTEDDTVYEGREPMVVYARKNGKITARLILEPPPCKEAEEQEFFYEFRDRVDTPRLKLEFDDRYPLRLINRSSKAKYPEAGGKIRVYPKEVDQVAATNANIKRTQDSGTRLVQDVVVFSGSSSASLQYPPQNYSITVTPLTEFRDRWGRLFIPHFRTWGSTITSVNRPSRLVVTDPVQRSILRGEVATADMFGNSMECYGSAKVEYVANYQLYELDLEFNDKSGERKFKDAVVIATLGRQTQTLPVSGPRTDTGTQ